MAWKIINEIQVDKENEPPISFETCKKLFFNTNLRFKNQTVGLSLEEQAVALACMCQDRVSCPSLDLKIHCKFVKHCNEIRANDWLEYLKSRQIPVDKLAK